MFTLLVKDMYSSYKDLPVTLYQIQTKYRDEFRRGREFIMKDAYSFTIDEEGMKKAYYDERGAYERIFQRLDLKYVPVFAMSGPMGGSASEEFLAPMAIGEDTFALAPSGKAWNVEALTTPEPWTAPPCPRWKAVKPRIPRPSRIWSPPPTVCTRVRTAANGLPPTR